MRFLRSAVIASFLVSGGPAWSQSGSRPQNLFDPYKINARMGAVLEEKKQKQNESAKTWQVYHSFSFADQIEQSQITFRNQPVDDAARDWKPAHYDHGTAVAAADIDADGKVDLYFVRQLGGNQLWRNLGNGKFENITPRAGVALDDRINVAAAFADVDNDGRPDLFVTTVKMGNVLFRNQGNGKFADVTREAGLGYTGHSSGAVFFDFDRDGWLDLFVSNVGEYTSAEKGRGGFFLAHADAFKSHLRPERSEPSRLYRNLGNGKFQEVSEALNLVHTAWSGDASACDVNADGFPDLYVVNMQGDDRYYENQGGKRFLDKTAAYFPKTPWGAMGVKFFDFNLDGLTDLFLTDMHSDMTTIQTKEGQTNSQTRFEKRKSDPWCGVEWTDAFLQGASNNVFGNAFYRNMGQGRFAEVSDQLGVETYWPWGVSAGDLNADGYEDLFVTAGMGYPFRYGINSLLLNERGERFVDSEFVLGVEPRKNARRETAYFNLDCAGTDKNHSLCEGRTGTFTVFGSLSSRSSLMLDFDDDGDLDLITNEMIDRPQMLVNNLTTRKKVQFLKVRLIGTRSNRDGLGAAVRVHAGNRKLSRYHDGKSGYLGQSVLPLYFGLGDAQAVDSIEVDWPSGARQIVNRNLRINTLVEITEPRSNPNP